MPVMVEPSRLCATIGGIKMRFSIAARNIHLPSPQNQRVALAVSQEGYAEVLSALWLAMLPEIPTSETTVVSSSPPVVHLEKQNVIAAYLVGGIQQFDICVVLEPFLRVARREVLVLHDRVFRIGGIDFAAHTSVKIVGS